MLSILTVTTLFPNPINPMHGIFVATRLEKLVATGQVESRVIAPVPWLPPLLRYPPAGRLDKIPAQSMRGDTIVQHPRYIVVPKIGMTITPFTLYRSLERSLKRLLQAGHRFELIDAHYFYPDGVAAVWLGQSFDIPVVVTARGTDLNLIPEYSVPRRLIVHAARDAAGLVTVCEALKDKLVELNVAAERVRVLRNGVDLELFHPKDRAQARKSMGFRRRTIGSVGHLIERKGHHLAIQALTTLPDTDLIIVGSGPERRNLLRLAARLGVAERLQILDAVGQPELANIYRALDALVLASSREGWPNVLLESMACGTPVVASAVWGTPEVVRAPAAGVLMQSLDARGLSAGVRRLFENYPDHAETRKYAEQFSWDATTEGQLALFREILAGRRPKKPA